MARHPLLARLAGVSLLLMASTAAAQAPCGTVVSGAIAGQTWTLSGSPYCVTSDIIVGLLEIEPGVTVIFQGDYEFSVGGTLTAVGTSTAPILFTKDPSATGWQGLRFDSTPPGSSLIHCTIEGATNSGIRLVDSTPTIQDCIIQNNAATIGGGIHITGPTTSGVVLERCQITANAAISGPTATTGGGGGLFLSGNALLIDCIINNNLASVTCEQGLGCLSGGGNTVSTGGGILASGNLTLANCIITDNLATAEGNGIFIGTYSYGGGLFFVSGSLTITNSIIGCNATTAMCNCAVASPSSSGVHVVAGTALIENSTIANNTNEGFRQDGGTATMRSTIVWDNAGPEIQALGGTLTVSYSDVQAGYAGIGNISVNPVFANAALCQSLEIILGSQCVDAGDPASVFNDACFPPSLGDLRNDIGAHGGPGACGWVGVQFVRGNVNQDASVNIADAVALLDELFLSTPAAACADAKDINDDGTVNIADPVFLLAYLFSSGSPAPALPFPACGQDGTMDGLGCVLYPGCP